MDLDEAARRFREFVAIVQALRTPGTGCPWDLEQTHQTLRPYLVEETYEVLDALEAGDDWAFREELGDLLLQVVLHAQLAADRGAFAISEVVGGIAEKMVRRHPHVFGDVPVAGADEVLRNWEQIKADEKAGQGTSFQDAVARLPSGLPGLHRAQRVIAKAIRAGHPVAAAEELTATARQALDRLEAGDDGERALGDLLLTVCQLAQRRGLSAEDCLRSSTRRLVAEVAETAP